MPSELSWVEVPFGEIQRWLDVGDTGDMLLQLQENVTHRDQVAKGTGSSKLSWALSILLCPMADKLWLW